MHFYITDTIGVGLGLVIEWTVLSDVQKYYGMEKSPQAMLLFSNGVTVHVHMPPINYQHRYTLDIACCAQQTLFHHMVAQ